MFLGILKSIGLALLGIFGVCFIMGLIGQIYRKFGVDEDFIISYVVLTITTIILFIFLVLFIFTTYFA